MPKVLVVIPAFNEQDSIATVLSLLRKTIPDFDVLVVDDGSTDETGAIVDSFADVVRVQLPYNLGIGAGMQTGFKYAFRKGYDIVVQCDADGQHPVEDIVNLVARVEKGDADVVIGSRYVAHSEYRPTLWRRIGKSILSRLIDALIGGGVTDTTSGFRAMNRRALAVFARHYPEDYPEPEALVILHKAGLRAAEVPVEMQPRQGGQTSINTLRAGYYIVKVAMAVCIDLFRRYDYETGEAP